MIHLFDFTHRFKRSMLEITSDTSIDVLWKYYSNAVYGGTKK